MKERGGATFIHDEVTVTPINMLEGHIQGITSSTIYALCHGALEIPGTFTNPCFGKSGFEAFACHVKLCIENSHITGSVNGSCSKPSQVIMMGV